MSRFAALLLMLVVVPMSAASRQTSPQAAPKFKAGVELVVLDVSVLDKDRQPVRGLAASDFTVLEDGKPQAVASFSAIELPDVVEQTTSMAPWVRTVAPDVTKNSGVKDRRVMVIVMDDAGIMPPEDVQKAKALGRQMVEALGPEDLACVAYTFNKRGGQEFTQDKARLLAAVERFNTPTDRILALDYSLGGPGTQYKQAATATFSEPNLGNLTLQKGTLFTIQGLAEDLGTAFPGRRKALVLTSVGMPIPTEGILEVGGFSTSDYIRELQEMLREALATAQRNNVTIYGLDPGGLRAPYAIRSALEAPSADPNPARLNQDFLKTVSASTGGFTTTDNNDAGPQIQQIIRENASYYLLGYAPPVGSRAPGRYHRLEVRVKGPGLTVRARTGYVEPKPETAKRATPATSAAVEAMAGVLPKTDLSMSLAAAPFAVPGQRNAAVAIVVQIERPTPKQAGRISDTVDVHAAAYTPTGDQRAATNRVFPVNIKTSGTGGTIRFELPLRLDLPPGRYHLRVGAERKPEKGGMDESTAGREGGVYADLDVPDFADETLSLSGLVLNVASAPTSGPREALASILPFVPTTTRDFRPDDRVTTFLRVYQGGDRPPVPVTVATRLVDGKGGNAFETAETLGSERFAQARAADLRFDVPTAKLSPGPYLLTVEAKAGKATARRDVRFVVQ